MDLTSLRQPRRFPPVQSKRQRRSSQSRQQRQNQSPEEVVLPILEAKGWSVFDWANEAEVAHATAMDYLRGKTKSYRSTRVKLARALGIPVNELPH